MSEVQVSPHQFPCHHFSSLQDHLEQRAHRLQDELQQQHQHQRYNVKQCSKTSGQCEAATGNAVTLGGAREVIVEIRGYELRFAVQSCGCHQTNHVG